MSLISLIIIAAVIVVIFLILRIIMKSIKMIAAVIIILAFLGIWLYGFSGFFDKVSDTKDIIPELGIENIARSITGCTTDIECSYIINPGDCRMAKEYCNNVIKEENYAKMVDEETLKEPCNRTSVEIDYTTDCECKLHKEREGKIQQWLGRKVEEKIGYTYCWKKE